eukprot:scaffold91_cov127-Cylindrotheca_fusiformis.AAC.3
MEMNIPGLCNGGNTLDKTYSRSERIRNGLVKARCNGDLFEEAIEKPWYPKAPYETARPDSDTFTATRRFSNRASKRESFNYAKALLESDTELDRLAQKISAEICDSEMLELAAQAEKAAEEGLETFSGRPSSFVVDNIPGDRGGSYSEGGSASSDKGDNRKIHGREMRHINEVIPEFHHLNAHMRTHLFSHSVDEKTLVFSEVETSKEEMEDEQAGPSSAGGSSVATQSMEFFRKISGLSMMQTTKKEPVEEKAKVPTASESVGLSSSQIAVELSAPPLFKDPSFDAPYESDSSGNAKSESEGDKKLKSNTQSENSPVSRPEEVIETLSLFDEGNEDIYDESCPSSPSSDVHSQIPHPPLHTGLLLTPRLDEEYFQLRSEFSTPERLRDIRRNDNGMSTPISMKFNFSPSSIVDSAYDNNQLSPQIGRAMLRDAETRFLQLPTIKGETKPKDYGGAPIAGVEVTQRRTIKIPQRRRIAGEILTSTDSTNFPNVLNLSEKPIPWLDTSLAVTEPLSSSSREVANEDTKIVHKKLEALMQHPLSPSRDEHRQDDLLILSEGKLGEMLDSLPKVMGSENEIASRATMPSVSSSKYTSNDIPTKATDCPSDSIKVQAVHGENLPRTSPPSGRETRNLFKDSENKEFLSNYFYCGKPKGQKSVVDERKRHRSRFYCGETIERHAILCHGVDTVCNGLDYLFPNSTEMGQSLLDTKGRRSRGLALEKTKSESSQSGWLSALSGTRFSFSSKTTKEVDAPKDAGNFRPPFLKRGSSSSEDVRDSSLHIQP